MKKTFKLTAENKKPARQVDSVKHEIKKYLTRERRKEIPDNVDFWEFDCKIGENENKTTSIKTTEINSNISNYADSGLESFYIEILAIPGYKTKKSE